MTVVRVFMMFFFLPQRLYTVFRSLLKQQNIQAAHAPALVVLPHATC
jgi:hypothetical protein